MDVLGAATMASFQSRRCLERYIQADRPDMDSKDFLRGPPLDGRRAAPGQLTHGEEAGGARHLQLRRQERGGPPLTARSSHGFGTRLTKFAATRDLGGKVQRSFAPEGVTLEVMFPLQDSRNGEWMPSGPDQSASQQSLTVLVVGDEMLIAADIEMMRSDEAGTWVARC